MPINNSSIFYFPNTFCDLLVEILLCHVLVLAGGGCEREKDISELPFSPNICGVKEILCLMLIIFV